MKLSPNDKTITIKVYVDNTFSEGYFQNGRVAMTIVTPATTEASMGVFSSTDTTVESVKAWAVDPIWVTQQDVTNTPRVDGK
jgi:hypothetical protein